MQFLLTVLNGCWDTLSEMAPYLLLGFLVAGILSFFVSPALVERHLGGRGFGSILKAALFGAPLPLCSCGVIPVAASLRRHGSSRGATAAFLLSTPQTGADSVAVTFSLLGPVFAVFRPLAAVVTGLLGGAIIEKWGEDAQNNAEQTGQCEDACCASESGGNKWRAALRYGFITLPRDIGKPLLLGLLAAGLISALIPASFFSGVLGSGFSAMLIMMVVGIPVYVCATASVPIAAAMIAKGMTPGAGLVFLMTGPATNAAAIAILWKMLGRKSALLYLAVVGVAALVFGLALDQIFAISSVTPGPVAHRMLPAEIKSVSAVILLALLAFALLRKTRHAEPVQPQDTAEQVLHLAIGGMSCSHCANTLQRAISRCPGVAATTVSHSEGAAEVRGRDIDASRIVAAVEGLGYKVRSPDENMGLAQRNAGTTSVESRKP